MTNGSWRANPALVSILVSNLIFLQHLLTLIENNLNVALPYRSIRLPLTLPVGSPCTFCPLSHQTKNSTAKLHLIFFRQSKKPKLSSPNNMVGPFPWNLLAVIFVCCFASSSAALSQSSSALAAGCQFPWNLLASSSAVYPSFAKCSSKHSWQQDASFSCFRFRCFRERLMICPFPPSLHQPAGNRNQETFRKIKTHHTS